VHGGGRFSGPAIVDDEVRAAIADAASLAPLHNRAALEGIDAATLARPGVPQVACFDTAFHRTLPLAASTYAIPREWSERFGARRYGFHGLNVQWCRDQAVATLGAGRCRRLVVCHLGSGCSISAVLDGRSIDTTMGFTPLDGVPMATRSGSVDPGLLLHLLASGVSGEELDDALSHRSGLLGICGHSSLDDVQRAASAGDARAQLAFDVLVRGVSSAVAAMTTSLRGLDALVFSGGMGERSSLLRASACERLEHLGVTLDAELNARCDSKVSARGSAVEVLVVPAHEEIVIARLTARALDLAGLRELGVTTSPPPDPPGAPWLLRPAHARSAGAQRARERDAASPPMALGGLGRGPCAGQRARSRERVRRRAVARRNRLDDLHRAVARGRRGDRRQGTMGMGARRLADRRIAVGRYGLPGAVTRQLLGTQDPWPLVQPVAAQLAPGSPTCAARALSERLEPAGRPAPETKPGRRAYSSARLAASSLAVAVAAAAAISIDFCSQPGEAVMD